MASFIELDDILDTGRFAGWTPLQVVYHACPLTEGSRLTMTLRAVMALRPNPFLYCEGDICMSVADQAEKEGDDELLELIHEMPDKAALVYWVLDEAERLETVNRLDNRFFRDVVMRRVTNVQLGQVSLFSMHTSSECTLHAPMLTSPHTFLLPGGPLIAL